MLELGKEEVFEHKKIIELLQKSTILKDNIFLVGVIFSKIKSQFQAFSKKNEIIPFLDKINLSKKLILIKGSRNIELETLLKKNKKL